MKKLFLSILFVIAASSPLVSEMLGPQRLTTGIYSVSSSGTVTVGARSVEFIFSASFVGTIDGVAFAGGTDAFKTFPAIGEHTYPVFVYTISAGSVRIIETR